MSINLTLSIDGENIPLYQTPTWVTEMCLMNPDGGYSEKTSKTEATRAIHCYLVWAYSQVTWGDNEAKIYGNTHKEDLLNKLKTCKTVLVGHT